MLSEECCRRCSNESVSRLTDHVYIGWSMFDVWLWADGAMRCRIARRELSTSEDAPGACPYAIEHLAYSHTRRGWIVRLVSGTRRCFMRMVNKVASVVWSVWLQ